MFSKITSFHLIDSFHRLLVLVMAAILGLLPVRADGVSLSVETPVTSETKVLCVTVQNDSRRTLSFGVDAFELMKEGANGWETLEKLPHAVIEIAQLLYPSDSTTIRVDLPALYGRTLSPGTYRFVFQFRMENRREPEYCMAQTDFIVTE